MSDTPTNPTDPTTMQATVDAFTHCGGCGSANVTRDGSAVRCGECGWCFFTNVAAASAVLLEHGGQVLLVRRSREPAKGKLGIPGGFVDPGETAAQAACRELREELRLDIKPADLRFLTTAANVYPYRGVTYYSMDTYFTAELPTLPDWFDESEIVGMELVDPQTLDPGDLAFDAARAALAALRESLPR